MISSYPSPENSDNSRLYKHSPVEECGRFGPLGPVPHRSQGQCRVPVVWGYWGHKVEDEVVVAVVGSAPPYGERWAADKEEGREVQEPGDVFRRRRLGRSFCMGT
ncbi:hypothetical protein Lal_00020379 [Lupinus albus]|nr:hypothetical protein Lal_00020379 [Lupinus albus]